MKINKVCVLGGTGFVGRHLVHKLANEGIEAKVLTRHPHRNQNLQTGMGVELVKADIFEPKVLAGQFADCDAVINLIGILNPSGKTGFRDIHVDLPEKVVNAAKSAGVKRLLHMSALQANEGSGASQYLRSKGEGENRIHTLGRPEIAVTSFRPSVIFGVDDSFINRFASLIRLPGPLPLACPDSRFAPVYVEDVAEAFYKSLQSQETYQQRYELCGPQQYSLEEIVRYIARHMDLYKEVIRLPDWAARLQGTIMQHLPGKIFTTDNYLSLQVPSVCATDGLAALDIEATHMDEIIPAHLRQERSKTRLRQLRGN